MILEKLSVEAACRRGGELQWLWLRSLSEVYLGEMRRDIALDELIEVRFFNANEEIRLFRNGGELKACALRPEPGDEVIEKSMPVSNPKFGKSISVCQQLAADDDGQTEVVATRLTGWEG